MAQFLHSSLVITIRRCFTIGTYVDKNNLWQEMTGKNKGMYDKRTTLSEAVQLITDGQHLALGGCHYSRTPLAMIKEIICAGVKDLTVSRSIISFEGDFLLVSGVMKKAVTSWFSGAVTYGVSPIMRAYMQEKRAEYEEWSHLGIGLRYRAGAMGIPFIPAKINLGSDLMKTLNLKKMDCPYSGEKVCLIPALNPDVAVIHVQEADKYGNARISGMPGMDPDLAKAARKVILTTEKIIENSEFRRNPHLTSIPFFAVDAVIEVPYGAFPHDVYGYYEPDYDHFSQYYQELTPAVDKEACVKKYLEKYFYGPKDFMGYLEQFEVRKFVEKTKLGGL